MPHAPKILHCKCTTQDECPHIKTTGATGSQKPSTEIEKVSLKFILIRTCKKRKQMSSRWSLFQRRNFRVMEKVLPIITHLTKRTQGATKYRPRQGKKSQFRQIFPYQNLLNRNNCDEDVKIIL